MEGTSRKQLSAFIALATLAIAWGAIPLFVRNDIPATQLVGVRVTFGALALFAIAASVGKLKVPDVRKGRIVASGILLALHWITFFQAIKLTTVAVTLAVLYVGPIVASILSGPLLGEKVSRRLWLALSTALVGTILVVQPWVEQDLSIEGVLVAALSAALLTALMLLGKPVAQEVGGLALATGELAVASVLLAPMTFTAVRDNGDQMWAFLLLGAVFTGVAGFAYWEAMRHLPIAVTSVAMYLEPTSAVLWAAAFLGETPNLAAWAGIAMVIVGGGVAATDPSSKGLVGAESAL